MTVSSDSSPTPVRVALVGLGGHGHTLQRAAAESGTLRVVAVYDPDDGEARAAAARFGCPAAPSYEALLARDDLEAVSLCSPNHLHRAQAAAALAAGLDVFVEKPVANTVADGRAMVDAAERAGRLLMVGHNMRYGPAARRAHDLLAEGRVGDVASVEVHFSSATGLRLDASSWRLRPDQCPLLPMMQLGIHGVDLLHYFIGPVTSVYAQARSIRTPPPVVDSVVAAYALGDGAHGTMTSNYCTPVRFAYRIAGTHGALAGTPHTLRLETLDGTAVETLDASDRSYASYVEQMRAFGHAVRSRVPPETDGWTGLQALAVVEAMTVSLARRAPVPVSPVRTAPLLANDSPS